MPELDPSPFVCNHLRKSDFQLLLCVASTRSLVHNCSSLIQLLERSVISQRNRDTVLATRPQLQGRKTRRLTRSWKRNSRPSKPFQKMKQFRCFRILSSTYAAASYHGYPNNCLRRREDKRNRGRHCHIGQPSLPEAHRRGQQMAVAISFKKEVERHMTAISDRD